MRDVQVLSSTLMWHWLDQVNRWWMEVAVNSVDGLKHG